MNDDRILQEIYRDDPWKMLCGCIMLNLTSRKQVDKVRGELFWTFPTAEKMQVAEPTKIVPILHSLGMSFRKAQSLVGFSRDWVARGYDDWPPESASELADMTGIGPYAMDSYRFFVLEDTSVFESGDKVLSAWLTKKREEEIEHSRRIWGVTDSIADIPATVTMQSGDVFRATVKMKIT